MFGSVPVGGDAVQIGHAREAGHVGEGVVGVGDALLVLWPQKAVGALAGDLVDGVDEQHPAAALGGLAGATDHHAGLHRRVEGQVRPQPEHALELVGLDQLAPHLTLFLAEQHAVREQDGAAAGLWVKACQDVLEEGKVRLGMQLQLGIIKLKAIIQV